MLDIKIKDQDQKYIRDIIKDNNLELNNFTPELIRFKRSGSIWETNTYRLTEDISIRYYISNKTVYMMIKTPQIPYQIEGTIID